MVLIVNSSKLSFHTINFIREFATEISRLKNCLKHVKNSQKDHLLKARKLSKNTVSNIQKCHNKTAVIQSN